MSRRPLYPAPSSAPDGVNPETWRNARSKGVAQLTELLRAEYERTDNGSYALEAYRINRAHGSAVPAWALAYLDAVALRFRAFDRAPKRSDLMAALQLPTTGEKYVGWRPPGASRNARIWAMFWALYGDEYHKRGADRVGLEALYEEAGGAFGVSGKTVERVVHAGAGRQRAADDDCA